MLMYFKYSIKNKFRNYLYLLITALLVIVLGCRDRNDAVQNVYDAVESIRDSVPNLKPKLPSNAFDIETMTEIVTGKIAHDIERNMNIYESYMTTVSISKSQDNAVLYKGLNATNFVEAPINVSSQVKVFLIDPSGGLNFKITPINNEEQFVDIRSNTIWKWNVMPIKKGDNLLILRATIKIFNETSNTFKDVNVFEEPITINSSLITEVKVFMSNNWQYLLSTLLIPFGLWFFKRRKASNV